MNAMFGSDSRWRNDWNGFMSRSTRGAVAMSTVSGTLWTSTTSPIAFRWASSTETAMPLTAPIDTASAADVETAFSTVDTAQSALWPRAVAIERMLAIASLLTFSPSVPVRSWPPEPTGEAAPMFVPGAMYANAADIVMNVPALAARPPLGAT